MWYNRKNETELKKEVLLVKYPIRRAVHIDFHTLPGIYNFNEGFDAKVFAERLRDAGVEYVNAFARCNIGFAYYPTKIGIPYPQMKGDMFGDLLRECHRVGIGVSAYFNGGLDHEHARLHQDWCLVNKDGQIISGDRTANFFRVMCYRTGYRDHFLTMLEEFLMMYPDVDGLFIDCMVSDRPCYCNSCCEEAARLGLDFHCVNDMEQLRLNTTLDFAKAIKNLAGDRYVRFNGIEDWIARELDTHGEIECLPSAWTYDCFLPNAAYLRQIFEHNVYMTGRFQRNWADFGGVKAKASLENDVWDAMSNAVGIMVGDHMHPAENADRYVYQMIGEVYDDVKRYEPYTENASYVADIGVLTAAGQTSQDNAHCGLSRMLSELKYGFDIVNEFMDFSRYSVLILPDAIEISPLLESKLRKHLDAGKGILSSGLSGVNTDRTGFVMPEWAFRFDGVDNSNVAYWNPCDGIANIPDRPWEQYEYGKNILFYADPDGLCAARYVSSYFQHGWDGKHGLFYTPPEKDTGHAAIAKSGNIWQFCFPVFSAYYTVAPQEMKRMVEYCLRDLMPKPTFLQKGLPSTARLTLTQKGKMRIAHIKTTYPERRGRMDIIEEHNYLPAGAEIQVKGSFRTVSVAPDGKPLEFTEENGYTKVALPQIYGYMMVVLEE